MSASRFNQDGMSVRDYIKACKATRSPDTAYIDLNYDDVYGYIELAGNH